MKSLLGNFEGIFLYYYNIKKNYESFIKLNLKKISKLIKIILFV
jgi:hypothetical protein